MKLIIRLMDEDRQLLGWCEVEGVMHGDGCIRASTSATVLIERDGVVTLYNAHWTELNTNLTVALTPHNVAVGDQFHLEFTGPIFEVPASEVSLPAVTVRKPQLVEVPCGSLGVH